MIYYKQSEDPPPMVSVVSIALRAEEFEPLIAGLKRQTFQDYEFIGEAGGSIPSAWNRAIQRARGEIIVLTETDARPVNERWLEEMVSHVVDRKEIVKGLEVTHRTLDFSNLALHRSLLEDARFDSSFEGVEDVELLCRMRQAGHKVHFIDHAPVINLGKTRARRNYRRAFQNGLQWARLNQRYGNHADYAHLAFGKYQLAASFRLLIGLLVGWVISLPARILPQKSRL